MTELKRAMQSARKLKELAHSDNAPMLPIIEMMRGDQMVAIIGMAEFDDFDSKEKVFTECLYAVRSLKCDRMRFLADAHMSKVSEDDYDPDNMLMPSQDPKAVDVILGYEWKDGQPVEAMSVEYHTLDDGTLKWSEIKVFPEAAVESWMNNKVAWAYENPKPTITKSMELGRFMLERGHEFALFGENDEGR